MATNPLTHNTLTKLTRLTNLLQFLYIVNTCFISFFRKSLFLIRIHPFFSYVKLFFSQRNYFFSQKNWLFWQWVAPANTRKKKTWWVTSTYSRTETLSYSQTFYELALLSASAYVVLLTLNKTKEHNYVHENKENETFCYHYE